MEMNLGLSERVEKLRDRVSEIIRKDIMPMEYEYHAEVAQGDRWTFTDRQMEIMNTLKKIKSALKVFGIFGSQAAIKALD